MNHMTKSAARAAKKAARQAARDAKAARNARDAEPVMQVVDSIDIDGRILQVLTEWWDHKPEGLKSWPDPEQPKRWLTARIYDPAARKYFASAPPEPAHPTA
jgi:hypothetical protein